MLSNMVLMIPITVLLHLSHETPLYLLASGREEEAVEAARTCNMTDKVSNASGVTREPCCLKLNRN